MDCHTLVDAAKSSVTLLSNPDLLTAGYFREYETVSAMLLPSVIQNEVSKYCQTFVSKHIGKQKDALDDTIIVTRMNELYTRHIPTTIDASSIKIVSTGRTDADFRFIYTANHRLFQYFEDDKVKEIKPSTFLTSADDELIDIKCGKRHCLFLSKLGNVFCIGSNDSGQCGLSLNVFYVSDITRVPIANNVKISSIACGNFHSLFIDESQRLMCCGYTFNGQCGMTPQCPLNGSESTALIESPSLSLTSPSASYERTYAQFASSDESESDSEFAIPSPRKNLDGPLFFDDDSAIEFSMIDSDDDSSDEDDECLSNKCIEFVSYNRHFEQMKISKIDCGSFHSLCLTQDGDVWTFGSNTFGTLGNGKCFAFGNGANKPHKLRMHDVCCDIAAGSRHNLLLTASNEIFAFGANDYQQCAMSNETKVMSPIRVSKCKQFELQNDDVFVEKVLCHNDKSLLIVNPYKRANVC